MREANIETLSFDLVDDICLALTSGSISENDLPMISSGPLGPLLELHHSSVLNGSGRAWLTDSRYQLIVEEYEDLAPKYREGDTHLGRISINSLNSSETAKTDFYIRSRRALEHAGFSKPEAAQMLGAIDELYSNVIEHSGSIERSYIAYAASERQFEFVIADYGIGIL